LPRAEVSVTFALITVLVFLYLAVVMPYTIVRLHRYNVRERRRFIDEGCRADFVITPRPRPWIVRAWRRFLFVARSRRAPTCRGGGRKPPLPRDTQAQ
jgi:hypothetical protein